MSISQEKKRKAELLVTRIKGLGCQPLKMIKFGKRKLVGRKKKQIYSKLSEKKVEGPASQRSMAEAQQIEGLWRTGEGGSVRLQMELENDKITWLPAATAEEGCYKSHRR